MGMRLPEKPKRMKAVFEPGGLCIRMRFGAGQHCDRSALHASRCLYPYAFSRRETASTSAMFEANLAYGRIYKQTQR
jgi:hypothetical protein